jgi:LuxR family quorum sensing-dependent transcriptional regulator
MSIEGSRIQATQFLETLGVIDRAETPEATLAFFSAYVNRFGFVTVAAGQLSNPALDGSTAKPKLSIGNWPEDWRDHWIEKRLVIHDPIAKMALRTRRPFTWRTAYDRASKSGRTVLDMSREYGFRDGLAIPIYADDSPPGCVTLGADVLDLLPEERGAIELLSLHFYMRLETLMGPFRYKELRPLSARESEVLHYVAAGKTNWEIGMILSISEYSVRDHISSAQKKLNCANRAHTVAVAIQRSEILP